ncbi:MAG: glycosyltransferase involved in cell wall biosynthesis [Neolewinella sp.]|jgi:glycosyltransferase involved in cell wall biosynthesis
MKIVIIGTTAASILGFRWDLIKSLALLGHSVTALAIDYNDKQREQLRSIGVEPLNYKFSRAGLNPISDIKNTFALARLLKTLDADLVFSYFVKPVVFGTLAARLAKVPRRIAMLEGLGFPFTEQPYGLPIKTRLIRWVQILLYRFSFPFLGQIIFLNPDDPVDLLERYKLSVKKISVLGGIGLNLADYPYSAPVVSPVRFVFVGRLLAEKGVFEFIDAAAIVKQRYCEAEFVMIGGLDESNPGGLTQDQLNALIAGSIVIYPGYVHNVDEWLADSSVFVLPSYREGYPRSTQEAMAIGRAVITTDVPGCRETVVDGVNGFIVPPWSAKELAKKMLLFIEQPSLIETMGKESYRIAQDNFNAEKVSQRLISMLIEE